MAVWASRQSGPMLPSRPRILAIANPCLGSSKISLSTSHSASASECSSPADMPKGYEIRRGAARPAVLAVAGTLQGRRSAAHDRGEPSWRTCLLSERLSQLDALVAEVGGDLQRAAECCHVGGAGPDLGRTGLGALDGGHSLRAGVRALRHLPLGQPPPVPGLRQGIGPLAGHERGGPALDLRRLAGEELVPKRFPLI